MDALSTVDSCCRVCEWRGGEGGDEVFIQQ